MADLDAELALFQAEIAATEEDTHRKTQDASQDKSDKLDNELARFEAELAAVPREKKRPATATLSAKPQKKPTAAVAADQKGLVPKGGPRIPPNVPPPVSSNGPVHRPPPMPMVDPHAAMTGGWGLPAPAAAEAAYGAYNMQMQSAGSCMDEGQKAKLQAEAIANVKAALAKAGEQKEKSAATHYRQAAGKAWVDETLSEWPEGDHRLFVGDLGSEVNDELLSKAFHKYQSFNKAKIVRDKRSGKSKGFGFVSMQDAADFAKALREMNGKYIGNRPCKLSKSTWTDRANERAESLKKKKGGKGPSVGKAKCARNHIPTGK